LRYRPFFALALLVSGWAAHGSGAEDSGLRKLPTSEYLDKARGAWAGQMIGVAYGAPTEFKSNSRIIEGDLPPWTPDRIRNALGQDDLYVELSFLQAIETYGLHLTFREAAKAFAATEFGLAHANSVGRDNIRAGTAPPWSGHPIFNRHANDIDFQIEADLLGIISPGMPAAADRLCTTFGHLMNYGDGLYGGMFVAGMYSAVYFEDDPEAIVRTGLACIHPKSAYAHVIRDVLEAWSEDPADWERCWRVIQEKWGQTDYCRSGYGKPFNIDAKINGAWVTIGLLYGGGDFGRTIEIATRCGDDSDCNPSTAGGVLGAVLGFSGIPEEYKSGLSEIADQNFSFTDYSFSELPTESLKWAIRCAEDAGGGITVDRGIEYLLIPRQEPEFPPILEQFTEDMLKTFWLDRKPEAGS